MRQNSHRNNTNKYFLLPSFPKNYLRLSIIRFVPSIVIFLRPVLLFPFVVGILADRNRSPGRVPGWPWNLSIRPTRSPPSPTDLQLLRFSPPFVPISNTTVPSPNLLALSILYWVSSFLGFSTTYLASILFISLFLFSLSCVQFHCLFWFSSLPILLRARASSIDYFFPCPTGTPQIFLLVDSQKITEILRSSSLVLIQAFVPSVLSRETRHFSIKYHGSATSRPC